MQFSLPCMAALEKVKIELIRYLTSFYNTLNSVNIPWNSMHSTSVYSPPLPLLQNQQQFCIFYNYSVSSQYTSNSKHSLNLLASFFPSFVPFHIFSCFSFSSRPWCSYFLLHCLGQILHHNCIWWHLCLHSGVVPHRHQVCLATFW